MTKSILVIETPSSCQECRLLDDDNWYCMGYHEACDLSGIHNRPSWCPLKPMPDRIVYKVPETIEDYKVGKQLEMAYGDGWNACIEEIEK